MSNGLLIVYAGASGVGKGTIMKRLLSINDNFRLSVSATTRSPREGERDGIEYYFVTQDKFDCMLSEDGFLEHATYCGNSYGTPKKPVFEMLNKGIDVFLEIEINGFLQIKEKYPECVSIFIMPPSAQELKSRLVGRGTESSEVISQRLKTAETEMTYAKQFDYVVINDDVDRAVQEIINIISEIKRNKKEINHEKSIIR